MQPHKTYRRKLLNFSIKRDMQFRMIGKIILILTLCQLLTGLIFYYFSNQEVTSSFQLFHIKARNFLDFLLPVVLGSAVVSLVVGLFGSLFFPKPIAGGLYRIEKDLQQVIDEKDYSVRIILREGDQVTSLATQVNKLLALADEHFSDIQKSYEKAEKIYSDKTIEQPEQRLEELKKIHDSRKL